MCVNFFLSRLVIFETVGVLSPIMPVLDVVDEGLQEGVTDEGLGALASAGCGALLTSLALESE